MFKISNIVCTLKIKYIPSSERSILGIKWYDKRVFIYLAGCILFHYFV